MQKLINFSEIVVWVLLSCSVLLAFYDYKTDLTRPLPVAELVPAIKMLPEPDNELKPVSIVDQSSLPATRSAGQHQPSMWKTLRQEFQLDTRAQSAQVQHEIRKLLAEPKKLSEIFQAAVPYIYYIHEQIESRGLPAELALIPVIESEFNPWDKSRKGASGLWQLMRQTAHELGVKVQGNYDGRRNVVASTKAALAYFKDLGVMFKGNWYLAIAAYNCGQGRVQSAMHRSGSKSFWNLPLPQETKYYVPRLLAVAEIVKHPEKYGITLPKAQDKPYFVQVTVKKVKLADVAKTSGVSIKTLQQLNPDYARGPIVPNKKKDITVLVPVERAAYVKANLSPAVSSSGNHQTKRS